MINRIFYACQGVFITDSKGVMDDTFLTGVQSVSIEQVFDNIFHPDMGRVARNFYSQLKPSNNITIRRVCSNLSDLLGSTLTTEPSSYEEGLFLNGLNHGYTTSGNDATDIKQYTIKIVYGNDSDLFIYGEALDIIEYKRCLLTNISINLLANGNFVQDFTFSNVIVDALGPQAIPDASLPIEATIQTRKDFDKINSVLPTEVVQNASFGDYVNGEEVYGISDISIKMDIGYVSHSDTGLWRGSTNTSEINTWTTVQLPLEVTSSFTIHARKGQKFSVANSNDNFEKSQIRLVTKVTDIDGVTQKYSVIDLGINNIFKGLSISGGDTSGGNVDYTLDYSNYNDFSTYTKDNLDFSASEQGGGSLSFFSPGNSQYASVILDDL